MTSEDEKTLSPQHVCVVVLFVLVSLRVCVCVPTAKQDVCVTGVTSVELKGVCLSAHSSAALPPATL